MRYVTDAARPPRTPRAPLAPGRSAAARWLPDRRTRRADGTEGTVTEIAAGPALGGGRGRVLAGAPGGRRHPGRRGARRTAARGGGAALSTSTAGSACSPARWPTPAAGSGGWRASRPAVDLARQNLADVADRVTLTAGRVERGLGRLPRPGRPRGAGPAAYRGRRGGHAGRRRSRRPRAVAYVACDPAALARDLATAPALGYRRGAITAYDLFPMTHHVECVAVLTRLTRPGPRGRLAERRAAVTPSAETSWSQRLRPWYLDVKILSYAHGERSMSVNSFGAQVHPHGRRGVLRDLPAGRGRGSRHRCRTA